MLKNWNNLANGALLHVEFPDEHCKSGYRKEWALYIGNGLGYIIRVNGVRGGSENITIPRYLTACEIGQSLYSIDAGVFALSTCGAVRAYSINRCNQASNADDIVKIAKDQYYGQVDMNQYLIMEVLPEKEYTVDEISKLLGRKVKIVGQEK
jgi:hypothetical protein